MAINKISDETKRFIKKKTASALPDRPGDFNIKASEIKSFLHKFVTDDDNSIFSEIDRIVDEVNLRTADIETSTMIYKHIKVIHQHITYQVKLIVK